MKKKKQFLLLKDIEFTSIFFVREFRIAFSLTCRGFKTKIGIVLQ